VLARKSSTVASGSIQLRFPVRLKPLATPLVYNLILLNNFLLDYAKMLTINVHSATIRTQLSA